jgi:chromosome segregation protein
VLVERRRSMERDRGQLLDAGVVANLEADVARFRDELAEVAVTLEALAPAAEEIEADEAAFRAEREQIAGALGDDPSGAKAASAAAEVRGELRSVRAERGAHRERTRVPSRAPSSSAATRRLEADASRLRDECASAEAVEHRSSPRSNTPRPRLDAEARRSRSPPPIANRQLAAESVSRWNGTRRGPAARTRRRPRPRGSRTPRRRRRRARHAARPRRDRRRVAAAVEAALGEALGRSSSTAPTPRRALDGAPRVRHQRGRHRARRPPALSAPRDRRPRAPHVRSGRPGVSALLDALIGGAVRIADPAAAVEAALVHPDAVIVTGSGDRFGLTGWRVGARRGGRHRGRARRGPLGSRGAPTNSPAADDAVAAPDPSWRPPAGRGPTSSGGSTPTTPVHRRVRGPGPGAGRTSRDLAELESSSGRSPNSTTAHHRRARSARRARGGPAGARRRRAGRGRRRPRAWPSPRRARGPRCRARLTRRDLEVRNAGLHERQQFLERRIAETERRLEADQRHVLVAAERRERDRTGAAAIDRLADGRRRRRAGGRGRARRAGEIRRRQSDAGAGASRPARAACVASGRPPSVGSRRCASVAPQPRSRRPRPSCASRPPSRRCAATSTSSPPSPRPRRDARAARGHHAAGRARELERELRLLGPINPLALEEFTELQQRHTFLEEQLEDVRSTRRELPGDPRGRPGDPEVFAGAFADVSRNFTQLFSTLFPGGTGTLRSPTRRPAEHRHRGRGQAERART